MIAGVLAIGGSRYCSARARMVGGGGGWGALLGLALLFILVTAVFALVVGPIVFGSQYAGYKDTLAVEDMDATKRRSPIRLSGSARRRPSR